MAQKQRTRTALLEATRDLLAEGRHPTVAEAADRATISRATAYRYFSSPEAMAQEAVLDAIAARFAGVQFRDAARGSLADRAEAVTAAIVAMVIANEALFRTFLGVAVGGGARPAAPRGGRRLGWIREALSPHLDQLPATQGERLVSGLALLSGIETVVVLRDVCGFDDAAIDAHVRGLARTLAQGLAAPPSPG